MDGQERIWKCAGCGVVLPISCDCVTNVAVSWEPEFTAILKADLRVETASENVARDMREGRFPERSSPLMVRANKGERGSSVLAALPEVQALIAAAIEAAAKEASDAHAKNEEQRRKWANPSIIHADDIAETIRNLTPDDATAALARIVREAEARGMRRAAAIALRQREEGDTPDAILARAEQIERDARITCTGQQSPIE